MGSRIMVSPMVARSWGFGIVWDGRVKDLHFYCFGWLITFDCYFERKRS